MSAWTAIVIPIFIIAKCSLDIVGMEYASKYQCMTDHQFIVLLMISVFFSSSVDLRNFFKSRN